MLDFCRALVDFILMAQYCSHDNVTLKYLDQALMRINVYKKALWNWRRSEKNPERRFDFCKFHGMLHYSDHVNNFGTMNGYNTAHFKANHKFVLKLFYNRINKRENFLKQLVWHNQQRIKTLAMKETVTSFHRSKDFTDNLIEATVTKPTKNYLELKLFGIMD